MSNPARVPAPGLAAALALALLALAPAAHAEASPAGQWTFETAELNGACKLSGRMSISRPANGAPAGSFTCRFTSIQSCEGKPPIRIEVAQTCTLTQTQDQVVIASRIERIVSVAPKELSDQVREFYQPDHFRVRIDRAASEMTGMFHSLSSAAVRFVRMEELTS